MNQEEKRVRSAGLVAAGYSLILRQATLPGTCTSHLRKWPYSSSPNNNVHELHSVVLFVHRRGPYSEIQITLVFQGRKSDEQ